MALQKRVFTSNDGTDIYAEAAGSPISTIVFAKQFADRELLENLVAYDMRGHGRSGKPEVSEAYPQTPVLVGWSLGAAVAVDVCHTYGPSTLSGIIYMGAQPYLAPEMQAKVATDTVMGMIGELLTDNLAGYSKVIIRFTDSCVADPAKLDFATKMSWLGCVALQSLPVRQSIVMRVQDPTRLFQEGAKVIPLFIIHGALDLHCKGDVLIEEMKAIFVDFEAKVIPDAGHASFWDQPEIVREHFLRFAVRVTSEFVS
ncbi:alpha/beta-hydrolase [Ramaria rubella]|nr:alpha/beta-hydrolase [Ramaria rubella]